MSRRRFLIAASALVAGSVGSVGAFVATREPGRALAPWRRLPGPGDDPRLFAFAHAVLAPNPHNRQPWLVELVGADEARLFCDLDRRLPQTDPFDRQITIGLGCFVEIAAIAAAQIGIRLEVDAFPQGMAEPRLDARPVARLRFVRDPATRPDPLFAAIVARRSNKEPFDMARPLAAELLAQIARAAGPAVATGALTDAAAVAGLRGFAWEAFDVEMHTPRTHRESVELMRIGKAEIEAMPDGIDLGGPFLELLRLAGQLSREKLIDPGSQAFKGGLDAYRKLFAATPAFIWVTTPGNTRGHQLAAGRAYVRLNLAATRPGVAMHPVSQALQEFAEMDALRGRVASAVGVAGETRLQMLARIGYGPAVAESPRWPLESRLRRV
ncbi:MAG: twin-arginine translocation pathway signal protein [Alphaproteobacteria bacterium]|nr:twin-arginine translocation pathway signal protein [Alphaproteobacteria bacterium]